MSWAWIEAQAVIIAHEELLERHGGLAGLRDRGALESALQRPQNLVHYDGVDETATLAAAYLVGVAKAHAFADGNKRTAWVTALGFLELNKVDIDFEPADALHMVVRAADSSLDLEGVAQWFRERCTAR